MLRTVELGLVENDYVLSWTTDIGYTYTAKVGDTVTVVIDNDDLTSYTGEIKHLDARSVSLCDRIIAFGAIDDIYI